MIFQFIISMGLTHALWCGDRSRVCSGGESRGSGPSRTSTRTSDQYGVHQNSAPLRRPQPAIKRRTSPWNKSVSASSRMDSLLQFGGDLGTKLNFPDANNNEDYPLKKDKYSLRPRSLRRVTELAPEETSTRKVSKHHQKQKPAPLSKYRRKTANARERNRMREINQAFETLRRVIPHMQAQPQVAPANEKLTKITTLRLAMKYISSLSASLNGTSSGMESSISIDTLSDYSDLDCLLLESDGESMPSLGSEHSLLASPEFPDTSLSPVDFSDPCLPSLFSEHALEPGDFSEFLLT